MYYLEYKRILIVDFFGVKLAYFLLNEIFVEVDEKF